MLDNRKFASFIAAKRRQAGLTQQQVSDKLGVSFQAVSKWETGSAYPNVELLLEFSRILNVSVDEILNGQETPDECLTYRKAGVDISYTDIIKKEMAGVLHSSDVRVIGRMNQFAALYDIKFDDITDPVLVLKAEEPGSKQLLATKYGYIESICHDMVNHLVNDIAVMGAKPLAVLDTIVCGSAEKDTIKTIVKGVADACWENDCALIGGETSIQPGVLDNGKYILTASVAGIVDRSHIIDGTKISDGDRVLAVASNGLHTNGYSLIRMLMEQMPTITEEKIGGETFLDVIMRPHTPYYKFIKEICRLRNVTGMAHITGGGIRGNLSRIVPEDLCAQIDLGKIQTPAIFGCIKSNGNISDEEMLNTFNCGIGLVITVQENHLDFVKNQMLQGHCCYEIGEVTFGKTRVEFRNTIKWT